MREFPSDCSQKGHSPVVWATTYRTGGQLNTFCNPFPRPRRQGVRMWVWTAIAACSSKSATVRERRLRMLSQSISGKSKDCELHARCVGPCAGNFLVAVKRLLGLCNGLVDVIALLEITKFINCDALAHGDGYSVATSREGRCYAF